MSSDTSEETKVEPKVEKEEAEEPVTKKDPRKVEAGKKLAAISKAAKEKKMREKIKNEMSSSSWFSTIPFRWLVVGGSVLIFGSYFTIRLFSSSSPPEPQPKEKPSKVVKSEPPKPEPKPEQPKKKFESLG